MIVRGVLVDDQQAAWLVRLLAEGRRSAAYNGLRLPGEVVSLLAELEARAARATGPTPPAAGAHTVGVREAAEMLGCSERRVTQLLNERKLRGWKQAGVWAVDAGDVVLRIQSEPLGTPSEAA